MASTSESNALTLEADASFHGYAPVRVVDDVINSFNDCTSLRLLLTRENSCA